MFTRRSVAGPAASLVAAAFWIFLAWRTPSSTHHFAPLVVAMMWGFVDRSTSDGSGLNRPATSRAFIGGLALGIGAAVILAVTDKLQGPGLYGSLPVLPELVLHSIAGATIGARPWTLFRPAEPAPKPEGQTTGQ